MLKLLKNIRRTVKIIRILYKHKALFWVSLCFNLPKPVIWCLNLKHKGKLTDGERLSNALENLGPIFIKLGQTLSTRSDFVGEEISKALSRLQDKVPPFSSSLVISTIETELGGKMEQFFSEFQLESIAAASISQVHQAVTIAGKKVAVKILRPGIEQAFAIDLELLLQLANFLAKRVKSAKRLKPVEVVQNFANIVKLELDLRLEAASASLLKENCLNDKNIYIPEVDWQLTSQRVLTMEWVDGIPISEVNQLASSGHNLEKIAANLAITMFNQAYRDGFFHADLHPGNILVNAQGKIVLLDFGIMGHLDNHTRIYVAEILRGFLTRDYTHVAKIHFTAGYVPNHHKEEQFALACRSIGEPIFGQEANKDANKPANKISVAKLLAQLFKITEDFDMETRPELLLLQKTMMLVEGVGSRLSPEVNLWQTLTPWVHDWAKSNIGFDAQILAKTGELLQFLSETLPRAVALQTQRALTAKENIEEPKITCHCGANLIKSSLLVTLMFCIAAYVFMF